VFLGLAEETEVSQSFSHIKVKGINVSEETDESDEVMRKTYFRPPFGVGRGGAGGSPKGDIGNKSRDSGTNGNTQGNIGGRTKIKRLST
jgi:hypothetical protein